MDCVFGPTIVRPEERRQLAPWLALELPLLSGHLGLVHEFGADRDVIADYATNVFNQHTAATMLEFGASRVVASIELTVDELQMLVAPGAVPASTCWCTVVRRV